MAEPSVTREKQSNSVERCLMRSALMERESMPSAAPGAASDRQLLEVDAHTFAECFDRRPFLIGHHLVGHPLFELPRLIRLSRTLPEAHVEYNAGDIPINVPPAQTPRNGLS